MANETKTVKKETGSNMMPIIIIGGILLATIAGIYMIMNSGDKEQAQNNKNSATNKTVTKNDTVPNYNSAPPGATPAHFKGSPSAAVVLEEFADFQCPTCATVHPRINEITSKYGNKIKVVYRHYPLSQIHQNAYNAAVASEAAGLQGKFWEMQNLIFRNQTSWANSQNAKQSFAEYAKTLGLNVEKFNSDTLAMNTKGRVDADIKRGRALNVTSTPTIMVNGKIVPQLTVASMSQLIDAELAKLNPKKETETKSSEESSDKKKENKTEEKGEEKNEK